MRSYWRLLILVGFLSLIRPGFGQEPPRPGWTPAEKDQLRRYAGATWHSFEAMAAHDRLPSDRLDRDEAGTWHASSQTSPTDIAAYLWSTLAAEKLALIDHRDALRRIEATLTTLATLERDHGFFFNLYSVSAHKKPGSKGTKPELARPFLSTVDNGWLAASLVMIRNAWPELRERADALLQPIDFAFFYAPFDPADPVKHPGQFHGGYYPEDQSFSAFYGMLNTEPRIVSYLAISRGQVPPDHYYRLFRTLPQDRGAQRAVPGGVWKTYRDVRVFEGHYDVRGLAVVPSWGGSMFEALMVPLFVPEAQWAPQSWGVNHPLYVQIQIQQGLDQRRYGAWGFSPCETPEGGYATYGVADLGSDPQSYRSFEAHAPAAGPALPSGKPPIDGVVTPHASFLALEFAPQAALANLGHLEQTYPIFGPHGFADSVNVATGRPSQAVLALDQGMILAAIANALADNALQAAFCAGPVAATIRPLLAPEEFTAHGRVNP